jgi:catechol-2,3-dioxygenase
VQCTENTIVKVHIKGVDKRISNNIGHLGITVPDIKAAERRFRELGVDILKGLGEETSTKASMCIPEAYWEAGPDLTAGFKKVFANMMMIRDPEGNFIEIVPHHAG